MNGMWERRGSTQDGQGDSLKALEELTSGGPRHPGGLSLGYICGQEGQTNDLRAVKGLEHFPAERLINSFTSAYLGGISL